MISLSELNNEQLMKLIDDILQKNGGETDAKNWSQEDIDRLLELTDRGKQLRELGNGMPAEETVAQAEEEPSEPAEEQIPVEDEEAEEAFELEEIEEENDVDENENENDESVDVIDIAKEPAAAESDERVRSIMEDEAAEKKETVAEIIKKKRTTIFAKIKNSGKNIFKAFRTEPEDDEPNELDEDLDDDDEDDVTPYVPTENLDFSEKKTDTRVVDLSEISKATAETDEVAQQEIEKPAEGVADTELDGQLVFSGMETTEEPPERIDESEAEKELFEKRKEKISKFTLTDKAESDALYGSDEGRRIGELFAVSEERPRRKKHESFVGVEYSQTKDARRIIRYLNTQKKKSFNKIIGLLAILIVTALISIFSAASTTVAGDRILTIFSNFVLFCLALVISNQSIVNSFELLKKKRMNINTLISVAAIVCFFQNLLMLIFYFANSNTVSVFSGAGTVLLLISEINNYVVHGRTVDAMEMCTGDNEDKLYSIEGVTDDNDAVELAKNVNCSSPRIRFSCKTKFPAHLIELCMSETAADKKTKLFLLMTAAFSLINMAVAWIVKKDFATGFAAFSITLSMCVPAYAPLLYELPLSRVNRKFNKEGGMISCQSAVNELCRTNVIIIDSKDLFDTGACSLHTYTDFGNVRLDDAFLYAAAMMIRSGGPLAEMFEQMIENRRELLPAVTSFNYEEKQGISGWISGQKVVLGNRMMMVNHNIDIPESVDEGRYLIEGHEVLYLGIAHKPAVMFVVDYAANEKIRGHLKKLRDSGVSILVRNSDSNVSEAMISSCYDMRLDNIKILNSQSGRIFKKYKSRPRLSSRAVAIHDGTPYTFMKSLSVAANLRHMFKVSDLLTLLGTVMGFIIVLILSIMNVICDLPEIFVLLMQLLVAFGFVGIVSIK